MTTYQKDQFRTPPNISHIGYFTPTSVPDDATVVPRERLYGGVAVKTASGEEEWIDGVLPWEVSALHPRVKALDPQRRRENAACIASMLRPSEFKERSVVMEKALKGLSEVYTRGPVCRHYTYYIMGLRKQDIGSPEWTFLEKIPEEREKEYAEQYPEQGEKISRIEAMWKKYRITVGLTALAAVPIGYALSRGFMQTAYLMCVMPMMTPLITERYYRTVDKDVGQLDTVRLKRTNWWEREFLYTYDPSRDNRPPPKWMQAVGLGPKDGKSADQ
eukprot:TRINITY_DN16321_c0_g1_i1.p1 TRINITY_DN16321_c0_g1~~TRINITY_DN16321_c0_g1_i1.p1  ORF type:complete len:274 (+),score=104.04 TRINITY_DN16321_c0_g1_i1:135-956(+)